MSVPSTSEVQATFAATLIDEWIRAGVREVVCCPGSRSTPLALAVAHRRELTIHVRIDERSAGFFAIGCARRSGVPPLVIVTSGTAAVELHAAVAEASHAAVPVIVATADRPPELLGVGAPQTTRQRELYGPLVRRFEDPGVARDDARAAWRPLASRLYDAAIGDRHGPVHVNLAFVEPLAAPARPLPAGRDGGRPWSRREPAPRNSASGSGAFPAGDVVGDVLVVAGAGARDEVLAAAAAAGWPVLGDVTCAASLPYFDAVLRADAAAAALAPDVVVRTGGLPSSKALARRLATWGRPVVAFDEEVADPDGLVSVRYGRVATGDRGRSEGYGARWAEATGLVAGVAARLDAPDGPVTELSAARAVVDVAARTASPLVVGSSMPVRDVEWWAPRGGRVVANRGLNGIDGVTSTLCGVAAGARAIGLVGDVTFLHDVSALVDGLGDAGGAACLVVLDNGGGGIFAFLPQATVVDEVDFARLFLTPRPHAAEVVARAFAHRGERVKTTRALGEVAEQSLRGDGLTVVVAEVPSAADNVALHDELNALVTAVLDDHFA